VPEANATADAVVGFSRRHSCARARPNAASAVTAGVLLHQSSGSGRSELPVNNSMVNLDDCTEAGATQRRAGEQALAEMLDQLLAVQVVGNGDSDSDSESQGVPTPLLLGPNPFKTINQQLQTPQSGENGLEAVISAAAENTRVITADSLVQFGELEQLTKANSKSGGSRMGDRHFIQKGTSSVSQADGMSVETRSKYAGPADSRGGAAAAANHFASAAAVSLSFDNLPLGVFAPRAIDLPSLYPSELPA